jgi:membrane protease YdiL (CAAX protease family)
MSTTLLSEDRASLCSFTFANGHHCRMPRSPRHLYLCTFHARKEAQSQAGQQVGLDLATHFSLLIVLGLTATSLHFRGSRESLSFLAPEGPAQIVVWVLLSATAGFCEETIFRGYLQKQFIAWSNNATIGILLSAVIFGACHIYQGAKAVVVITVYCLGFLRGGERACARE